MQFKPTYSLHGIKWVMALFSVSYRDKIGRYKKSVAGTGVVVSLPVGAGVEVAPTVFVALGMEVPVALGVEVAVEFGVEVGVIGFVALGIGVAVATFTSNCGRNTNRPCSIPLTMTFPLSKKG